MAKLGCFPALIPRPSKSKKKTRKIADANKASGNERPKVKPVVFIDSETLADGIGGREANVALPPRDVKVVPVGDVDRRRNSNRGAHRLASMSCSDLSDFDFGFHAPKKPIHRTGSDVVLDTLVITAEPAVAVPGGESILRTGSDVVLDTLVITDEPAVAVPEAADEPSPKLKRSCSNIETKRPGWRAAPEMPARSRSYGDLGSLITGLALDRTRSGTPRGAPEASPASVKTADRVMLKKRSSSQVLPSRSRKLWWRLFLWSHRNLHMPRSASTGTARQATSCSPGRHGGYTSDTFEEGPAAARKNKEVMVDDSPPPSLPNQWVAFSAENSTHDRISAWVSSIESELPLHVAEEEDNYDGEDDEEEHGGEDASDNRPRHLQLGEPSSGKGGHGKLSRRSASADDLVQANTIVQSLNAFSSVAHISGMGLKVMPMIAPFSTLRAVNLSSNLIVHISPGSLPKGLHSLDLSRNKIANVEGLRELTKLRVLNLSYNRISRIGHGVSNCTAIRELYLAGNKISDVEGLHRLLKLAVLDLSFNKITTAKALGQLVANYHSLLALNLVGNPVQANIGDDALRRVVTGLLPSLAYLNKQPVKPQRSAREVVATDSIARAALGGSGNRPSRKKPTRRLPQSPSAPSLSLMTRGRCAGGGSPTPKNTTRRR